MRVRVYVESSEGAEICVFNESVNDWGQCDDLNVLIKGLLSAERLIKKYVESIGE